MIVQKGGRVSRLTIQLPRPALDRLQHNQRRPSDHDEVPVGPDGLVVQVQPQRRARRQQQLELLVGRDAVRVQVAPARRVVDGQHHEAVQHVLPEDQGPVLFRHGRRRRRRGGGFVGAAGAVGVVAVAAEVDQPLVQLSRPVPDDRSIHRAERASRADRRLGRVLARKTGPDSRQPATREVREPRVHHARKAVKLVPRRHPERRQGRLDRDDGTRQMQRRVLEVDDLAAAEEAAPLPRPLVHVGRAVLQDQAVRDRDPDARLPDVGLGHEARQDDAQHGLECPLLRLVRAVGRPPDLAVGDAELRDGVAQHRKVVGCQFRHLGRPARTRAVQNRREEDGPRRREGLLAGKEMQTWHRLMEPLPELLDHVPLPDDATAN
ncbi:hypothetical protein PG997_005357 [Apiospora hydei]|uniref:Uncharacterized protein n=1 Tax=Apiospora hydei TaxID=1337664 RepID=A0ABR1X4R0_9PEZI